MARDAAASRGTRRMLCMSGRIGCLAGVARRALAVVIAAIQRSSLHVAIALRMGIVTAGAGHASRDVAGGEEMSLLIREGAHAAVGEMGLLSKLREAE